MSSLDRDFVNAIDVSCSEVARALNVSRQAVTKGINSESNYFSTGNLSILLTHLRDKDHTQYNIARNVVRNKYPAEAARILEVLESNIVREFASGILGEYTLITGDLIEFVNNLPKCVAQFQQIACSISNTALGQIEVLIGLQDQRAASRLQGFLKLEENQFIVTVCSLDLSLFPSTLMLIDQNSKVSLFGCTDLGFMPLSAIQANRIRSAVFKLSGRSQL